MIEGDGKHLREPRNGVFLSFPFLQDFYFRLKRFTSLHLSKYLQKFDILRLACTYVQFIKKKQAKEYTVYVYEIRNVSWSNSDCEID